MQFPQTGIGAQPKSKIPKERILLKKKSGKSKRADFDFTRHRLELAGAQFQIFTGSTSPSAR